MNMSKYQTLVFDCDGVLLNSNRVKTEAFFQAALPLGEKAANSLVKYHVERGGISRYEKFRWILMSLYGKCDEHVLNRLLNSYADLVHEGLMSCEISEGLHSLREQLSTSNWLVASGGDQMELNRIFKSRNIFDYFNGGVFGSPDSKDIIIERELENDNIVGKTVFLGDSKYDFEVARKFEFDFIFLTRWSEFDDWESYFELEPNVEIRESIKCL